MQQAPPNWEACLKAFQAWLRFEKGLAQRSLEAYSADIRQFAAFCNARKLATPTEVHPKDFSAFFQRKAAQGELNTLSQARKLSALRAFFAFLTDEYNLAENPTDLIESPRLQKKLPYSLSIEEVNRILDTFDTTTPLGNRNFALVELMYSCGLRVSETVALQFGHWLQEEGLLRILGKGNKERLVPIGEAAENALADYRDTARPELQPKPEFSGYIFLNRRGKPLTRNMVFLVVKEAAENAGIPFRVSPHTLRHSFATHLVENGADLDAVQQMLGHEHITTTELYLHMNRKFLRQVHQKYHPRK